jgi:hypothetical protein
MKRAIRATGLIVEVICIAFVIYVLTQPEQVGAWVATWMSDFISGAIGEIDACPCEVELGTVPGRTK